MLKRFNEFIYEQNTDYWSDLEHIKEIVPNEIVLYKDDERVVYSFAYCFPMPNIIDLNFNLNDEYDGHNVTDFPSRLVMTLTTKQHDNGELRAIVQIMLGTVYLAEFIIQSGGVECVDELSELGTDYETLDKLVSFLSNLFNMSLSTNQFKDFIKIKSEAD